MSYMQPHHEARVRQILEAAKAPGGTKKQVVTGLTDLLADVAQPDSQEYVNLAQSKYGEEGEIEIDENAVVSDSENGAYVMAWVWVDNPAGEDDDPSED